MARSWLTHWFTNKVRPVRRPARKKAGQGRFLPQVEPLAERVLPAVTATFSPATGVFTVTGDDLDNSIAVSRDAAGTLVVNGDGVVVPVQGGPATAANTTLIQIFGMGGNDQLIWARSPNLPPALIDGGAGNDTITSGTGNDTLVGGAGNDVYRLDTDTPLGSDTIDESGGGIDTLDFSSTSTRAVSINLGNAAAQVINAGLTLTLSAGDTIENVIGGDLGDTLTGNGLNNVILGGGGNDTLRGAGGDDVLAGGAGNDLEVGNGGNDTFLWNPGDGNDFFDGATNDGLTGSDRLVVNGSDAAEKFAISADGVAGVVTRDIDNVRLDLIDVETVDVNALGGTDTVIVNDLTGTGLTQINLDLAGVVGGAFGDGQADTVIVNGTDADDQIPIVGNFIAANSGAILINGAFANGGGLPFSLAIRATEGSRDTLLVNGLGGDDTVDASGLFATNATQLIKLTENGGTGNDVLIGSPGADTFLWFPADDSDSVEGGDGQDRIVFDGSDVAETFNLLANGTRALVIHGPDGVTVDFGGVETVVFNPLGGADRVNVEGLSGTGVAHIGVNLAATLGSAAGDGQADSVVVNGRNAADLIPIQGGNGVILITGGFAGGLSYSMSITGAEGAIDRLTVNGLGGDDTVDALNLAPGQINLTVTGGAGNDTLTGSQGDDTFVWNPGDGSDSIDGQGGTDTLKFVGSDLNEDIALSANGPRARLTRDVDGVTMDLGGLEVINVLPMGGADTITVNDLTGTGVRAVNLPLGPAANTGDRQRDTVIVHGTNGDDHINIAGLAVDHVVNVIGLSAEVNIIDSDGPGDSLVINALGGNDTVDASNLNAGVIGLTVNLGDGQGAAATTTTLRTSAATAVFGQAVLLRATVNSAAGTPTGTITFRDGNTVLGTAPVNANGQATLAVSLGAGAHALTASFAGTGGFTDSSSGAAAVTVSRAATAVTLASSVNPVPVGQAVTFTATVRGPAGAGVPTGTVTFLVGNTVVARVTLDANGQARLRRSFWSRGLFAVRAVFSGDAHFAGSSRSLTMQVN
jgi:Ca2+-binding RTX toxin-like protein